MLPPSGKTILKCQKILNKNFACTFQHFKCARQVSPKTNMFCSLCKKDKEMSHTMPFFKTKFCLFYTRHIKCRFFVEGLCKHIECRDICVKFCVQIFCRFEMYLNQNLKIRSICSHVPKHHTTRYCIYKPSTII
jgi:hypothetical protein